MLLTEMAHVMSAVWETHKKVQVSMLLRKQYGKHKDAHKNVGIP